MISEQGDCIETLLSTPSSSNGIKHEHHTCSYLPFVIPGYYSYMGYRYHSAGLLCQSFMKCVTYWNKLTAIINSVLHVCNSNM